MARGSKRHRAQSRKKRRAQEPARATARPERARAAAARPERGRPDWIVGGLAIAGMALTAYLTGVAWFGSHPAYCGAGSACDLVQSSRWSTLLGVPIAFWGFLTYTALAGIALRVRKPVKRWRYAWVISAAGLAISLYLTAISLFVIEAACIYCLVSLALIAAIFAVVARRKPADVPGLGWSRWLPQTAAGAGVLVLALHLHYSGVFNPAAGPEDPRLKALATHLQERGAKFYGAYWCPHCQRQKNMFEASADRLPYVECTPEGRGGPISLACVNHNISEYPTWIIDGKRYTGALEPRTLARLSDFPWQEAAR